MCSALVFVSIATSLVVTAFAMRERSRRREAEKHANYFYDELFTPTERECREASSKLDSLEDIVCRMHGVSPHRDDYDVWNGKEFISP